MSAGAIDQAYWETGPQESFSSQGPTNDGRIKPDISGPDGVSRYAGGGVATGYGTSYAAPHAAGAASLLLSKHPAVVRRLNFNQAWRGGLLIWGPRTKIIFMDPAG